MEYKSSISILKHIHKPITGLWFTVALLLCASTLITPLTAHAESSSTEVEAEYSDGTYSSSGGKWYATYAKDAGYKGQGVLLYLLERNGGGPVSGTTPKAFACGVKMETYELHAQDKYNRYPEVTTWERDKNGLLTPLPWTTHQNTVTANAGGFMNGSLKSNVPAIKAWLKTEKLNAAGEKTTQGIQMVKDLWEKECPGITDRFVDEQVLLVAEPIVAIQFSQYNKSKSITFDNSFTYIKSQLVLFKNRVKASSQTVMSPDLSSLIDNYIKSLDDLITITGNGQVSSQIMEDAIGSMKQNLKPFTKNSNIYKLLGKTYAGTPKMVASYYNSLTPDLDAVVEWNKADSGRTYYRKAACASAFIPQGSIICANANFSLLPTTIPARQIHSDYNIQTYSIGMLAMLAFTSEEAQSTCDEPSLPNPHPAPNESNGTTTIIKSYRIRNTETNTLTDRGTHTRSNLSNQILIEDEDDYKVIAWKTSTENITNLANFSVTWESSVPGIIGEQGDTITQVV